MGGHDSDEFFFQPSDSLESMGTKMRTEDGPTARLCNRILADDISCNFSYKDSVRQRRSPRVIKILTLHRPRSPLHYNCHTFIWALQAGASSCDRNEVKLDLVARGRERCPHSSGRATLKRTLFPS